MGAFYLELPMKVTPTKLKEVVLIEPRVFEDDRGFFMETFNGPRFESNGLPTLFVQDNHSLSKTKGTLRGLHYQIAPMAQGKLVRCLRGSILDVVVDIRRESPTFKHWIAEVLSGDNKRQLWVPVGFAHGFVTLEADTEVTYKVTEPYSPEHDRAIRWDDPELAVQWGITHPILSAKDEGAKLLKDAELF
jgi:dTDP-4-dehydrorhamnose 3,5-epimerase